MSAIGAILLSRWGAKIVDGIGKIALALYRKQYEVSKEKQEKLDATKTK